MGEGALVGQRLRLEDFQLDWIRRTFPTDRAVRRSILCVARKNGKTALMAVIVLAGLMGPLAITFGTIICAARSKKQAGILFHAVRRIILVSGLMDRVMVREAAMEIEDQITGVVFRAVSADAKLNLGSAPFMVVHDELGAVEGPRDSLFDALSTAFGAYKHALEIIISTQAPSDADLLSILIDDALEGEDPTTACVLYSADEDDDPFLAETWYQANPALGLFRSLEDVEAMAARAKRMPTMENSFRNLVLNQRIQTQGVWMNAATWKKNQRPPDLDLFTSGRTVYGGLDLSMRTDLCGLVLAVEDDDGDVHIRPTAWTPADTLYERAQRDRAPLDMWVRDGHLRACSGGYIRYADVAEELVTVGQTMDVGLIEYDRYRFRELMRELDLVEEQSAEFPFRRTADGEAFEEFRQCGQGFQSMTPALEATELLASEGRLRCGGHPVLNWCVTNATLRQDHTLQRTLDKRRETGRIDLAVCLAMACRGLKVDSLETDPGDVFFLGTGQ